jgi:hypothetical protein
MKNNKKIEKLKITDSGIEAEGLPESSLIIIAVAIIIIMMILKFS